MLVRLITALGAVALATAIALVVDAEAAGAGLLLLLAVVVAALLGRVPGLAAGVAGALSYSYYFIPPERTLSLGKDDEPLAFAIFVAIAFVVGSLVARSTELRHAAEEREAEAVGNLELVERLRAAEQVAHEAERAAETNQARAAFFAIAGHNLRTPLASVATAADTLLAADAHLTEEDRREMLVTIRDETDRLTRLVARVLELSRLNAGLEPEPEVAELDGLVQSAVRRLGRLPDGLTVELEFAPGADLVWIDITMTEEALVNVLENAVRFAPPDSSIDIVASRSGGDVVLAVSDHGPGIAAEDRERVFDEFYRGERLPGDGGTGLGLSIVRAVIEAQGGSARCTETPGGGATVELRMPSAVERQLPADVGAR
jgi:two-component system sensor histidine kinase KdpD